jgi:hypothetical protein
MPTLRNHDSNAAELPLDEALRRARADERRLADRERVLSAIGVAGLLVVATRGILGDVTRPLALGLSLAVVICLALLGLARRARAQHEGFAAHVRFVELVRDATDRAPASAGHPYRNDEKLEDVIVLGAAAARRASTARGGASWVKRGLAAAVSLTAIGLLFANATPTPTPRQRWTFVEPPASAATGLEARGAGSGAWEVLDDPHATGARALVNRAGDPLAAPALMLAGASWTRDLRAVTRCKVSPDEDAQACGVVFRHRDDANYLSARVDTAQGALVVSATVAGEERVLGRHEVTAPAGVWQELALEVRAGRIRLTWNGQAALDVTDDGPARAGAVGLWAPSAGVSTFDELSVEPLPAQGASNPLLRLVSRLRPEA